MGRVITSYEDCADCLCRVCARNECNDSYNAIHAKNERAGCTCECNFGDEIKETIDDCHLFLADEDDGE